MNNVIITEYFSKQQPLKLRAFLILSFTFVLVLSAFCQTFQWQSFTNTDDIRDVVWHNNQVWCATAGGLMAYHPQTQDFQVWTNSDGLTYNNIQAIGVDPWQRIWVGMANGHINILDPSDGSITVRDDMEGEVFEITVIDTTADWILVGHDNGLTIYRQGEGAGGVQIAETVPRFGGFPSEVRVSDVAVLDRDIWVSTEYGVARASIDNATLRPPTVWTTYNITQGLPQNEVTALAVWQGILVAGTGAGVAKFNGQQFEFIGDTYDVLGLYSAGDSLWMWTTIGVYRWGGVQWQLEGGEHHYVTCLAQDSQARLWAGHENKDWARGSLAYLSANQWSDRIIRNGQSWNKVNAVFVDSQRRLWASGLGLNMMDETGWHNWTSQNPIYNAGFFNNQGREIAQDPYGGIWVGSFGGGIVNVRNISNDTLIYDPYAYDGSPNSWLIGIPQNPYYVVVQDLILDNLSNLWIVDRGAINGNMLAQVPTSYLQDPQPQGPNTWNYVSVLGENLDADQENLLVDGYGRIWAAGGDPNDCPGKIYVLEGGVEDPSWTVFSYEDAIYINEMAIDHSGTMWFACRDGVRYAMVPQDLSYFSMQPFYGIVSGNVQCVHVDAHNNKWFGTDRGVSVLSAAYTWVHHFPSEEGPVPHGLVGSNVQKITSDYANGYVWIATTTGLSLVKTPYRESGGPLSSIKVFPNPFRVGDGNRLQFKTVDFNRVLFYTIAGKRIRELNPVEAITGWDGRDNEGEFVGSGIYLILATTTNGESKLGKVAVIR